MKKVISLIAALCVLLCCFSGAALAEEKITLKFANYAILESNYEAFWTQVEKDFEALYPEIDLVYVTAPYGEMVNQVINMAGGGDRVDLIFGEIDWTPTLEDTGLICPVGDVLDEAFLADFYPNQLEACSIGGVVYSLPVYSSPFVLYYNTQLFEQAGLDPNAPPTTYDEMLEMAEKLSQLTSADGNPVYAFGQTTASVAVSGAALTAMTANFGGSLLTADGELATDSDAFRQTFEMVKLLDEKGYNPQNAKLKDLRNLFALGQLAMYYDQSWGFSGVQGINPDAASFTASAKPLAGGEGNGASILQAHILTFVDNGDAQRDAAKKFTEFLVSEETLSGYLSQITPAYPSRISMADMAAITENAVLKGAAGAGDNTIPVTFISAQSDLYLELCTLAQAVTVGGEDFDTAYATFKSAAENLLY